MCADRESGSAVPEFVMVMALLLIVGLGVLQLGLTLYVRNVVLSSASEGARHGARLGSSPEEGAERARRLIRSSLDSSYAADVSARVRVVDGIRVVEVTARAPFPVVGLLGPEGGMTLSARAFDERQTLP